MQNDKTDETKIGKDGDKNAVLGEVSLGKVELDIREGIGMYNADDNENFE